MSKIGIIGTGKIGSHLAEHLLSENSISEINLANRDKDRLAGRLMSLQLRGHLTGSTTKIQQLDWKKLDDLDLIILCIKDNYDPRKLIQQNGFPNWFPSNLRYVGLFKDLPLLELICNNKLKNYKGKIAVITNPIEITSYFIQQWLPNSKVFGVGASLDSARVSYIIKNETQIEIDKYSCVVAGEHGNELIGVSKLWTENKLLGEISKKQIAEYLAKAKNIGFEIVNKLGFTLQDCTPVFADDMIWLLDNNPNKKFHSFAIPTDKTCISKPVNVYDSSIIHFSDYTNQETNKLLDIENRIAEFIENLSENFEI